MQDIVYKLVPHLQQDETERERLFYEERGLPNPKDELPEDEEEEHEGEAEEEEGVARKKETEPDEEEADEGEEEEEKPKPLWSDVERAGGAQKLA